MFRVIHCTNCDCESMLPISIKFLAKVDCCDKCGSSSEEEFHFYFCSIECFQKWLKKKQVFKNGFPCQSCNETGFFAGFEQNGKCKLCDGSKVVKETSHNFPKPKKIPKSKIVLFNPK